MVKVKRRDTQICRKRVAPDQQKNNLIPLIDVRVEEAELHPQFWLKSNKCSSVRHPYVWSPTYDNYCLNTVKNRRSKKENHVLALCRGYVAEKKFTFQFLKNPDFFERLCVFLANTCLHFGAILSKID